MARLDRLGPPKEVLQIGAVIGSDFSYELLRAVHPIAEGDLQAALRKLTDAELLYVRGIAPDARARRPLLRVADGARSLHFGRDDRNGRLYFHASYSGSSTYPET
jgi:hypothetical protein